VGYLLRPSTKPSISSQNWRSMSDVGIYGQLKLLVHSGARRSLSVERLLLQLIVKRVRPERQQI